MGNILMRIQRRDIPHLPAELIEEILIRLPIRTLSQSRYVCQSWHSIFQTNRLSVMHYNHIVSSPNQNPTCLIFYCDPGYYILDINKCDKAFKISHLPFKAPKHIVDSVNGLVCVSDLVNGKLGFIIFNPVNGSWMKIPDSLSCNYGAERISLSGGFGYDPTNKEYKLIRMHRRISEPNTIEILTLGSNKWRNLGTIPTDTIMVRPGAYLYGNLHWCTIGQDSGGRPVVVGCTTFNVEYETFGLLPIPDSIKGQTRPDYISLRVSRGYLFLSATLRESKELKVWIMREYGVKESWILEFLVSPCCIPFKGKLARSQFIFLAEQRNGNLLLRCDLLYSIFSLLASYNPKTKQIKMLKVTGLPTNSKDNFHLETFVPLKGTPVTLKDVISMEKI